MEMTNLLGCLCEQKVRKVMSGFEPISRDDAISRVLELSTRCELHSNESKSGSFNSGRRTGKIIKKSMNKWIPGYGEVYISEGRTKDGRSRIVIKHHIPGAHVCDSGGPGYDLPRNNFYEVVF
ncbi:MAG: hypothetical protein Q8L29_02200 [archaeon]|nr:hypothetical protein [archaeon]